MYAFGPRLFHPSLSSFSNAYTQPAPPPPPHARSQMWGRMASNNRVSLGDFSLFVAGTREPRPGQTRRLARGRGGASADGTTQAEKVSSKASPSPKGGRPSTGGASRTRSSRTAAKRGAETKGDDDDGGGGNGGGGGGGGGMSFVGGIVDAVSRRRSSASSVGTEGARRTEVETLEELEEQKSLEVQAGLACGKGQKPAQLRKLML